MKPLKISVVITGAGKALVFEWLARHFNREKFSFQFILLSNSGGILETSLREMGYEVHRYGYKNKVQLGWITLKLFSVFRKQKPDVVHCHLIEASIAGLTAAWMAGVKKRIYTRHHSTLHYDYYPGGIKYDKWCNRISTHIVAISEVVKHTLLSKEKVPESKISLIHHGFSLREFDNVSPLRIDAVRAKFNIPSEGPVIGMISRYVHFKGIEYAVEAFARLLKDYPRAHLVLANASGDYSHVVKNNLKSIPKSNYTEILFEDDSFALYKTFDVFVHVPVSPAAEAYGQTYIEALASGIPSVFTLSGIAREFVKDGFNALVADFQSSESVYKAIVKILLDPRMRDHMVKNGRESVMQFDIVKNVKLLELLYLS